MLMHFSLMSMVSFPCNPSLPLLVHPSQCILAVDHRWSLMRLARFASYCFTYACIHYLSCALWVVFFSVAWKTCEYSAIMRLLITNYISALWNLSPVSISHLNLQFPCINLHLLLSQEVASIPAKYSDNFSRVPSDQLIGMLREPCEIFCPLETSELEIYLISVS